MDYFKLRKTLKFSMLVYLPSIKLLQFLFIHKTIESSIFILNTIIKIRIEIYNYNYPRILLERRESTVSRYRDMKRNEREMEKKRRLARRATRGRTTEKGEGGGEYSHLAAFINASTFIKATPGSLDVAVYIYVSRNECLVTWHRDAVVGARERREK